MKTILLLVISWLVPGSGYWLAGKPRRYIGTVIFALLGLLILIGVFLADFRDVRVRDNPFYYAGRFGSGLTWLVTVLLLSPRPAGIISYQYFDIGHLYLCVAGALNVVVLLNILSRVYKVTPTIIPTPDVGKKTSSDSIASTTQRSAAVEATDEGINGT